MDIAARISAALICSCLLLCACASAPQVARGDGVVLGNVPFYPQEDHQCGPASLAQVLNYQGLATTPEEVAGEIFSKSARGTLTIDMVLYAQRKGLAALNYSGGIDDLREKINAGYPLIVMVDYGFYVWQANHFMVIVGYNDDGVVANSGKKEHEFIKRDEFLRIWKRTGYWSLLVRKQ